LKVPGDLLGTAAIPVVDACARLSLKRSRLLWLSADEIVEAAKADVLKSEAVNLAVEEIRAAAKAKLRERILTWIKATLKRLVKKR